MSYRLAAVGVDTPAVVGQLRKIERQILLPGQTRFHASSDRDSQRRHYLAAISPLDLWAVVFHTSDFATSRGRRDELLGRLAKRAVQQRWPPLLFDHVDPVEQVRDRQTLAQHPQMGTIGYSHAPFSRTRDPLLQAADAIAWFAGRREYQHRLPTWVELA